MKKLHILSLGLVLIVGLFMLAGCADVPSVVENENGEDTGTGFVVYGVDSYDSADTSILISKNTEESTLTFYNLNVSKNYTLEYDGTTCFYDKYGTTLSLNQISVGQMVDVKFIKSKKHLTSLQISSAVWAIEDTLRYTIDATKRDVLIGEDTYKLSGDVKIFSGDKLVGLQDLISSDTLTFMGIDTTIYSVMVTKGHGYLKLTGQDYFVDGWIEIGTSIIQRVSEDMLIPVPEGSYEVNISNAGTTAVRTVSIARDSETTLDLSDVEIEEPKAGVVFFSVSPKGAELYIDGVAVDYSSGVQLSYGLHQLICKASGYSSVTEYINVGQASAAIDVTLDAIDDKEDEETDGDGDSDGDTDPDGDGDAGEGGNGNPDGDGDTDGDGKPDGDGDADGDGNPDGDGDADGDGGADGEGNPDGNGDADGDGNPDGDDLGDPISVPSYKVYIDAPDNCEVYLDGSYIGVSPCSFDKVAGTHIITLCKTGYITRSYTITVGTDDKDVNFSFVELLPETS